MKTMITIKAEFDPGTEIDLAFKEAIRIAIKLFCYIEFNFNGITCIASPDSDYKTGVMTYKRALSQKTKVAISW